ncbi:unnamed protein product [Amoebophrya sp. A25]|nr:unnamed protein product [Amoebophrya sp. A25]|eukprot:GSA25T00007803001.1
MVSSPQNSPVVMLPIPSASAAASGAPATSSSSFHQTASLPQDQRGPGVAHQPAQLAPGTSMNNSVPSGAGILSQATGDAGWAPSSSSTLWAQSKWRGRMVQVPKRKRWGLVVLEEGTTLHVQLGQTLVCAARTPPASPSRRSSKDATSPASGKSPGRAPSPDKAGAVSFNDTSPGGTVASEEKEIVVVESSTIATSSFAAIGACLYTKIGIGVLIGYRPDHDIHVLRYPHSSTTGYLQRDQLISVAAACPDLPVRTPYGLGICVRENKEFGTWTIRLTGHENAGLAHLHPSRFSCDSRFVPLVESGKRKWKRKQYKTYELLAKLQKVATETGVLEKFQDAYETSGVTSVYDTARKAWDVGVDVVEKEVVDKVISESPALESLEKPGPQSSPAAIKGSPGGIQPTQSSSSSSSSGEENNAFKTPPADDLANILADAAGDDYFVDGEFRDAKQGDEELVKAQKFVEDEAERLRKLATDKLAEHDEIVQEVYGSLDKLEKGGEKVLSTINEFGEKALEEVGKDQDVQEVLKLVESAKQEAAQVIALELEKGTKVYEKSKMSSLLEESRKRLEEKMEKLSQLSGQQIQESGAADIGDRVGQGLQSFVDKIAAKNDVWQAKGSALFGSVQRRYLAGPDGWIAKTRKKLQAVLKEDQLGLKQWDFSTYTNSFYAQANDIEREVLETTTGAQKERAKLTKKAVNSAAEQLVALAKPEESAAELLVKLDRMRGMEMLEAIDLQGILDKAGIVVPPYVAEYFVQDESKSGATSDILATLSNFQGDKMLEKVLDDQTFIGKAGEVVGQLEGALDKVADLAQNKTVQSLLSTMGGAGAVGADYDAAGMIMQKLETLDVDQALEMTERTLADLQDPERRAKLVDEMVDSAVDGLMALLPKIQIDNLEGESHDFAYAVGNINLGGFKLKKECVSLKINFETATAEKLQDGFELISLHAWNMSCVLEKVNFSFEQQNFPYLNGEGLAKCFANKISLRLGFSVRWKSGAPQLYMSRRMVDIEFLTMEIEESWFSALYNVLIAAFSNLILNYVNDKIEEQIDENVNLLTSGLDFVLQNETVKPWLASLAPRDKDGKVLPEVIPVNDESRGGQRALPLSSERKALAAEEEKKRQKREAAKAATAKKRPTSPNAKASPGKAIDSSVYDSFKPDSRVAGGARSRGDSGDAPAKKTLGKQESISEFGAALAQMTVMRSMLKSLKTGKPVTRGQVQQVLFSALYAVEDEDVKKCLSEIHEILVKGPSSKKLAKAAAAGSPAPADQGAPSSGASGAVTAPDGESVVAVNGPPSSGSSPKNAGGGIMGSYFGAAGSKIAGFAKNVYNSATTTGSPGAQNAIALQNEIVSGDERKQLIFGVGLALSLPKFQQPTLQVRDMNKKCQKNRKEGDPNKLVPLSELLRLTICWSEFNRKMIEDLQDLSTQAGGAADLAVVKSARYKTVSGNLAICQDALLKIKMDLAKSAALRDRRQLETIILHLLDAIRCHTDGSDILHEFNDERQRERRSQNALRRGRTTNSPTGRSSGNNTPAASGSASSLATFPPAEK